MQRETRPSTHGANSWKLLVKCLIILHSCTSPRDNGNIEHPPVIRHWLVNLVPGALFPGFGGRAGKAHWGRGCWLVYRNVIEHILSEAGTMIWRYVVHCAQVVSPQQVLPEKVRATILKVYIFHPSYCIGSSCGCVCFFNNLLQFRHSNLSISTSLLLRMKPKLRAGSRTGRSSRARSAPSGAPWVRKFGYLTIQEIMVLTKSSVSTSTPSCNPGWNFPFQGPVRSGGKSHSHPDLYRL